MLNQIILVGRISTTLTENKLTLAVPRSFKNEQGIYDTDFIPVHIFGTMADTTREYTRTGDVVGIKGRIQQNSTTNTIEIVAEKVTFLSSKSNPNPQPNDNIDMNKGEI